MRSFALEAHFLLAPATPNCGLILGRREHVLIGVSPFDSRFSDAHIEKLVVWARQNFKRFDLMLPGQGDAALLLEATGEPPEAAARKARLALGRKMKSIHSALHVAGAAPGEARIFRFSDFHDDSRYRSIRSQAEQLYARDQAFRDACDQEALQAVAGRLRRLPEDSAAISHAQVRTAVGCIVAELPFLVDTPSLLKVPQSLLACHRPWPVADCLCSGRFPLAASVDQGFVVLSPPGEPAAAPQG